MDNKTILITGISSGLGQALAEVALTSGHRVVGTVRNEEARALFDNKIPGRSFARILDVTDSKNVAPVVAEIENNIGAIDVLVNNAGYGLESPIEEAPLEEIRRQFEVNVFGAVAMIQAVLPFMRKRRKGHIINITSMGGLVTFPGVGVYNSSKFALEGISEALGKELKHLGIAVTAVEPGMFRTDWAGRSMTRVPRRISDYDEIFDPIRTVRAERSGKQPGDPTKAADAILRVISAPNPPAHLLLGPDALKFVNDKLHALETEISEWKEVTLSTNFDEIHVKS
jgi:NAD(P)-dependent dehydrogenase (short-subunit alcohol dehydrogenase family)